MKFLPLALGIGALALGGCATRPTTYEFKAGVTEAQYASDETSCIKLALDGYQADVAPAENAYHAPGMAGALGHGIGVGVVAGVARRKASETVHGCMRDRGYSEPQVTDEQWRTLQKLDETRSARARALMASGKDISSLLPN